MSSQAILEWKDVVGLDPDIIKKEVSFQVNREDLLSEDNQLKARYKLISVVQKDGTPLRLGEVPFSRPFIEYPEAMSWVIDEIEKTQVPFKLRSSWVDPKKYSIYQEYIFDLDVKAPDGSSISPVLMMRSSHVDGYPLEISMGTFRYICTNGAMIQSGPFSSVKVTSRNWGDLTKYGIVDTIRQSLTHYNYVEDFYKRMADLTLQDTYKALFSAPELPLGTRKKILSRLEKQGSLTVNVVTDRETPPETYSKLLKEEDLAPSVIDTVVSVHGTDTLWDVYNRFTSLASHEIKSSSSKLYMDALIDNVFSKVAS